MAEKIYILTHTDLDGYFSAGLTKFFYLTFCNDTAEFKIKHWTYGRDLPDVNYIKKKFDKIFILDLCPDTEFMLDLYDHFKDNFVWIDHHLTPDTEFVKVFSEKYPNITINGLRAHTEHTDAGVSLTWKYFYLTYKKDHLVLAERIPDWIKMLTEFDAWIRTDEKRWNNRIMPFFTYIKGKVTSGEEAYEFVNHLNHVGCFHDIVSLRFPINDEIDKCVKEGKLMYNELRNIYDAEAKHGFERILPVIHNGERTTIKAWVCNTQNRSSVIFETMENRDEYDVFIPFHFNGEKYFYSMYTFKPDISCSSITVLDKEDNEILTFKGHKDAAGSNSINFAFPAEP